MVIVVQFSTQFEICDPQIPIFGAFGGLGPGPALDGKKPAKPFFITVSAFRRVFGCGFFWEVVSNLFGGDKNHKTRKTDH